MRILLLLLLLSGCGAARFTRLGDDAAVRGQDYVAAGYYLDALDRKATHDSAAAGLLRVAEEGFAKRLARAEELERQHKYGDAAGVYEELARFVARVERHGALDFSVPDVGSRAAVMRDAELAAWRDEGRALREASRFDEALVKFLRVQERRRDYPNIDEEIAETHYLWAEALERVGQWRAAAERFQLSSPGPRRDPADRAARLHAALGRHFLAVGACRQAMRDLWAAAELVPGRVATQELLAAEDCAVKDVLVVPFDVPRRIGAPEVDLSALLTDAVYAAMRDRQSDFVALIAPTRLRRGMHVDYTIGGRVVEASIQSTGRTTVPTATGERRRACTQVDPATGAEAPGVCLDAVSLSWNDITAEITGTLDTRLAVIDVATGAPRGETFTADASDARRWAAGLRVDGVPVRSTDDLVLPDALSRALTAPREQPSRVALMRAMVDTQAPRIAAYALSIVDADIDAPDPRDLVLDPPDKKR